MGHILCIVTTMIIGRI